MLGKSDQLFFAPLVRDCPAAMLGPDRPGEFSFFSFGTLGVSSICVLFPGGSWPCEGSKSALPRDIYTGNVCYTPHLNTRCTPSDRDTWWGVFFFFFSIIEVALSTRFTLLSLSDTLRAYKLTEKEETCPCALSAEACRHWCTRTQRCFQRAEPLSLRLGIPCLWCLGSLPLSIHWLESFLGILDESKPFLSLEDLSQNTSKPGSRLCAVSGFTAG